MDNLESFWLPDFLARITGYEMSWMKGTYTALTCSTWITAVIYWDLLHLSWELMLFGFQVLVTLVRAQTTNEFWNQKKYDYYWKAGEEKNGVRKLVFTNPFNRGLIQNFLNFWTPYGHLSQLDYARLYSLPDPHKDS